MTAKADFTEQEWETVLEGPTSAGMIVSAVQRGGTFREVSAMAKAFSEARKEHGKSELLDEIVTHKPKVDRSGARSPDELKAAGVVTIREAVTIVEAKATPEELADYRRFVLSIANRVAAAKTEGDEPVSEAEATAITEITAALGD